MMNARSTPLVAWMAFALLLLAAAVGGCDLLSTEEASDNQAPDTELAVNEPLEGDTLFALVTMHWDGADYDGFVTQYEYRYSTTFESTGETTTTDWDTTSATSRTIAFNSPDDVNLQLFEVRAIDNQGGVDPSPATVSFYTRRTVFPDTEIQTPGNTSTHFALDETTDWWTGITLTIQASDEDGDVTEVAWAVDDGEWQWTTDTTIAIGPEWFTPLEGTHTLRVTSRDNTNLVDPTPDEVEITLLKPAFDRRMLIVDETLEDEMPFSVTATDEEIDAYYTELFGESDHWDYEDEGAPPREVLGRYQIVLWHGDNNYRSNPHSLPNHTGLLRDYMNVGGDFIMSGWRMLKSFLPTENFPATFEPGSFVNDYLHIVEANETTLIGDMTHALGNQGMEDVHIDSVKLAGVFPYYGKMGQINLITQRGGFTEVIYTYEGENPAYRRLPVGLQYYGTSFDAVVLGFPIFFLKEEDAQTLATQVLERMGY